MISYETILSSYDDKLTLLEWLKKVEEALADASLSSVEVIQSASNKAYFKFIFADGTHVDSPLLTLPKGDTGATGPQGPTGPAGADGQDGADGVSVVNVSVNASNHLIVTLSSGLSVDAGEISVPSITVDSAISNTSENPVQNKVIYNALANKQDLLEPEIVPGTLSSVLGFNSSNEVTDGKITASLIDSGNATNKYVLTADGSGNASWQEVEGGTQPTGQVTTTFTLPQDVEALITRPHGIVTFGDNLTLSSTLSNLQWWLHMAFDTAVTASNASGNSTALITWNTANISIVNNSNVTINNKTYYGTHNSNLIFTAALYNSLQTSLPTITWTYNVIKIVDNQIVTATYTATTPSKSTSNTLPWAICSCSVPKSANDLILLIEITNIS